MLIFSSTLGNGQQSGTEGVDWQALFRASGQQGAGGGPLAKWFASFARNGGDEGSFDFFGLMSIFRLYGGILQGLGGWMNNLFGAAPGAIGGILRMPGQIISGVGSALGERLGGRGGLGVNFGGSGGFSGGLGGQGGLGGGFGGNRGISLSIQG